jgi:hypothetical protein
MSKDQNRTVRIRKIDKVAPDLRGRSVWLGKVEPVELELVSTMQLEKMLKEDGGKTRSEIRKLVDARKDGVLARDAATGHFRILSEEEARKALSAEGGAAARRGADVTGAPLGEDARREADELSLVNTQFLRKVLKPEGKAAAPKQRAGKKDRFGGFDPYDNN